MKAPTILGGTFTFAGTSLTVNRMGYGAMQLAGHPVGSARGGVGIRAGDAFRVRRPPVGS
jgi:hypothetical protein